MRSFCKGGIYEEFVNSKKFFLPEGEGGAARRAGETEGRMRLPQGGGWAAVAAAGGVSAPAGGLSSGDAPPIFFSILWKRKRAVHGPKEKAAWARSGAVALRARRGSAYRCLLRFGLAFGHAIPFCEVDAAVPWRIVPRSSGVVVALNCFSFRCRWSGGRWEPVERADEGIGPYGDAESHRPHCRGRRPRPPSSTGPYNRPGSA